MRIFIFLSLLLSSVALKSQNIVQLSVYSEVSIITAESGDDLYEAFGHSAIRIKDPVLQFDFIYNYGMFDFDAPNFYTNFTKGKLYYKLGRYPFRYFLESYKKDKRWIKAQVLNLSQAERQEFFIYLEQNVRPENATYLYDPFFNNCASKLRDISKTILKDRIVFNTGNIEQELSLRTLMNRRIHWNSWGSFGINIALGNKLDKPVKPTKYMYLPDYVYKVFNSATIDGKPFVKKEVELLTFEDKTVKPDKFSPFLVFLIVAILGLWVTYKDFEKKQRSTYLDFFTLFTTGLIGLLLTFLWFFTNHSTTPNNFNILWAFLPNLIFSFLLISKKHKAYYSYYFLILLVMLVLMTIFWIIGFQVFSFALIPILIYLFVRYLYLFYFFKNKMQPS